MVLKAPIKCPSHPNLHLKASPCKHSGSALTDRHWTSLLNTSNLFVTDSENIVFSTYYRAPRWNSWKYNFVTVFGHNLEISQILCFYLRFLPFYKILFLNKLGCSPLIDCLVGISDTRKVAWFSVRFSSFWGISSCSFYWEKTYFHVFINKV